ncbi:MAG: ROK family protein [Oscillospiraceae bacterium]|nr:ROK family protein [Oscillospiraceae bacterium]
MKEFYLSLDLGGTKTKAAIFSKGGELIEDSVLLEPSVTFEGEERVYSQTKLVIDKVLDRSGFDRSGLLGIGVGAPGPLNTKTGVIIHSPMMGWRNFPIAQRLFEDFKTKVLLENDANLGALAEQRRGVAKGLASVGYMTVSTGIGGGIVLDGRIYHGKNDGAAEFGHISISPNGFECPCGNRGCLELYASGTALAQIAATRGLPTDIKQLVKKAEFGMYDAINLFREAGRNLGLGITTILNILDLELLVLGGGMTKARRWFEEEMLRTIEQSTIQQFSRDRIAFSKMSDHVVLYGAYYLISNQ